MQKEGLPDFEEGSHLGIFFIGGVGQRVLTKGC